MARGSMDMASTHASQHPEAQRQDTNCRWKTQTQISRIKSQQWLLTTIYTKLEKLYAKQFVFENLKPPISLRMHRSILKQLVGLVLPVVNHLSNFGILEKMHLNRSWHRKKGEHVKNLSLADQSTPNQRALGQEANQISSWK